jgi:hypothetical protein
MNATASIFAYPAASVASSPAAALAVATPAMATSSFFLTRIVLLRGLAFIYMVAFYIAWRQNKGLIGDTGLAPCRHVLDAAEQQGARRKQWNKSQARKRTQELRQQECSLGRNPSQSSGNVFFSFLQRCKQSLGQNPVYQHWRERLYDRYDGRNRPVTSILWLAKDRSNLNPWLDGIATTGLMLSTMVFWMGAANVPILLAMWICQRSLMAVGGPFYGYGWEPQLAELNFHLLFLVPLWSLDHISMTSPPSGVVLGTIRWYLFRIMFGAGLIKIKSHDTKWKWPNLSAMDYFYETQPVPNPLSKYFHWMPHWWHQGEVLINHFVELIAPILLLTPTIFSRALRMGGLIQIGFQAILVTSGNLSFLNWLTAVPAIACLDDGFLGPLFFSHDWQLRAAQASALAVPSLGRRIASAFFGSWIAYLSIPVVKNLLAKKQLMNGSFGPWRLVNTYGAFGTVSEERDEFIISAATDEDGPWKEYEFNVKPGDIYRRPQFISPYHFRLDWQMWIAALLGYPERSPWLYTLLLRLLQQDPEVISLLRQDLFKGTEKPKYIRIEKYRYKFSQGKQRQGKKEQYWDREWIGQVFPRHGVASKEDLEAVVEAWST